MTLFGFLAFVLVLGIVGVVIGAIVSPKFRLNLSVLWGKGNTNLTTPIDREMALIEKEEKIIADGRRKASDLRGTLNNERAKLTTAEQALVASNADLDLAIGMARKRGVADADLQNDTIVAEQAGSVQAKTTERDIQKSTVASIEGTVAQTKQAVEAAAAKLRELQLTVKSHEAKAKATSAIGGATDVLESFKGMNSVGSQIAKEGDKVNEQFEQAKARLEDAQGSQAQRDFEAAKRTSGLGDIIKGRTGGGTPTAQ